MCFLILLVCAHPLMAGITGSISGKVRDHETGLILPGASVKVEGTTLGAQADKNGRYMIHNLPAGTYDVSVEMIGYSKVTITNVQVNVDLNTELNFDLTTKVLPLEEVVVTERRQLIHSEITSSTYFISGEEINKKLPIDSYRQAISLLPGVVGNHFRGGRENEVIYMLDGLPIQGGLSRKIASYFPNSSIVEMMVQTGGFAAEYGQASSGIVNVVTKDGHNKVDGEFKVYSDFIGTGLTGNDNTRRLEFNVGGPMTIGLGGPLINANYFIAADLNLSDTAHRNQMREAFGSPIFKNYNLSSKLSFNIARNTILTFQGLLSNWDWRKFDPQWELNLEGLAENKHYSHRISASLTHTFSPRLFASLRLAKYAYKRLVLGAVQEDTPDLEFADPNDPNSLILSGEQPWNEETKETVWVAKLDVVGQLTASHQVKSGMEFQNYAVNSQSTRFDYFSSLGPANTIVINRSSDNYRYSPRHFAFYIQDQFALNGITANLGLRYDIFAPRIRIDQISDKFQELRKRLGEPQSANNSESKSSLSPRLGISIPLSDNERLHINYGWYYQMPSLYYYYINNERNLNGYLPLVGSVELDPIKTVSSEFSYKRVVSEDLLLVISGFTKQFNNLIDTQTFILPESEINSGVKTVGFSKYTNSASGRASGFEVTLQKRFSSAFSGRVSYTFMKATGTGSTAEDEFSLAIVGSPPKETTEFPLSWDQRHSLVLDTDYESGLLQFNILYRLLSPLPFTTPGSTVPNDSRLAWRNMLDLKVKLKAHDFIGGRVNPFFEIRNLFDEDDVFTQPNDSGIRAYTLFDPINSHFGRRFRVGMTLDF